MPVFGRSTPGKDQEYLMDSKSGNSGHSRLAIVLTFLGLALLIIFVSSSFYAYGAWRNHQNTPSNIFLVPEYPSDLIRIKVDGRLTVKQVPFDQISDDPVCYNTDDSEKFDCYPEQDNNQEKCLKRGCCWKEVTNGTKSKIVGLGVPYCYFPSNYQGYELVRSRESDDGLVAHFRRRVATGLPKEVQEVHLEVIPLDETRLRIKITDARATRFETPYPNIRTVPRGNVADRKYAIEFSNDGRLVISRISTGVKIIDTRLATMFYSDQLLQLNLKVPFHGYYGLGEHEDGLLRGHTWDRFVMLNRDREPMRKANLYGAHPFYLQLEEGTSNSHGLVLLNSNIMEIVTQPTPGITFRPLGGIFDFYVMLGQDPADVIKQYHGLIGHPIMPPYWSLGFHLCKYGYGSLEKTKEAYQRTKDAQIPFDVQWNDIDYMDRYNDFTYDKNLFTGLPAFVDQLHDEGMHYVMIMDVGVSGAETRGTYPPFDDGMDMDIFIKNTTGDVLYAKVWNTKSTVYPDFTNPRAGEYFAKQYADFYDEVKFDGSWIDMNEPSNMIDGSFEGCPKDSVLDHPYYVPLGIGEREVYTKTACMSALHYASTHYNLHNVHGFTNGIATNYALRKVLVNKRPFIISRSTFIGQGAYTGHWSGDINSNWDHLKYTIPATLNFAMYGFSMMGSDICGFGLNTTVELCARWQSVGSFYPFSRNHNTIGTIDQDPAALGPIVVSSTKKALTIRYRLLPYLYTLFYRSHVFAETLFRPLFFEYPTDKNTHAIDTTFLWGSAFLVIPILEINTTKVTAYIPKDVWYNYYDGSQLQGSGAPITFSAKLDEINLLVRGGYILPAQVPALTTTLSRENNFNLIVALDSQGKAKGELYWDDGETLDAYEKKLYNLISFEAKEQTLTSVPVKSSYDGNFTMPLDSVEIFGVSVQPKAASVNGKAIQFTYDNKKKVVKLVKFEAVSLLDSVTIVWK